jgi:hypothetical protein
MRSKPLLLQKWPRRLAENSVTYGIVLVDPSDTNASGIRIGTNSGLKALRKL